MLVQANSLSKLNGLSVAPGVGLFVGAAAAMDLNSNTKVTTSIANSAKLDGNNIIIDHGYGNKTRYAHLHSFSVKKGDKVIYLKDYKKYFYEEVKQYKDGLKVVLNRKKDIVVVDNDGNKIIVKVIV